MASQSLLFEQLSDSLQTRAGAKVVLLRSGDASNLKAALRRIILEVVANPSDAAEEQDLSLGNDVCTCTRTRTRTRRSPPLVPFSVRLYKKIFLFLEYSFLPL